MTMQIKTITAIVLLGGKTLFGSTGGASEEVVSCLEDADDLYRLAYVQTTNSPSQLQCRGSILRGVINIVTSPAEIIRAPLIEHDQCVMFAVGNTVARFLNGVMETVSLGCFAPSVYHEDFPEYIWNSKWIANGNAQRRDADHIAFMAAEKAACMGHAKAQHLLGDLYLKVNPQTENNRSNAIKWYERAVSNGDVTAKKALLSVRGF